ncbi:MAG: DNA repair protein RecO [Candidatus Latescibacteria bacterium 4484_181]|nr:MAG: DNA repair protein RecO [Candidatus Latescibacteria bacterium 4484_181]
MAILKTEAIVLRNYKWSETSNIVTLYSQDFGKIKAVAKGARRANTRFVNSLNPVTQSQILFYSRNSGGLHILKEASSINYFPNLKREIEKFAYASAVCELTEYLTADSQPSPSAYYTLHQTLNKMEDSPLEEKGEKCEGEPIFGKGGRGSSGRFLEVSHRRVSEVEIATRAAPN